MGYCYESFSVVVHFVVFAETSLLTPIVIINSLESDYKILAIQRLQLGFHGSIASEKNSNQIVVINLLKSVNQ